MSCHVVRKSQDTSGTLTKRQSSSAKPSCIKAVWPPTWQRPRQIPCFKMFASWFLDTLYTLKLKHQRPTAVFRGWHPSRLSSEWEAAAHVFTPLVPSPASSTHGHPHSYKDLSHRHPKPSQALHFTSCAPLPSRLSLPRAPPLWYDVVFMHCQPAQSLWQRLPQVTWVPLKTSLLQESLQDLQRF